MVKTLMNPGVLGTTDVAKLVNKALLLKRKTNPGKIRRLAKSGRIPCRRSSQQGRFQFDPELVTGWLHGGDVGHEFYVAFSPTDALSQVRELVGVIGEPENYESVPFEAAYQRKLCQVVEAVLSETRYQSILPKVRRLLNGVRGNAAFECLYSIPGLFE